MTGVADYRPDIDGLRPVVVSAVVLFHVGFLTFSGGYVGDQGRCEILCQKAGPEDPRPSQSLGAPETAKGSTVLPR